MDAFVTSRKSHDYVLAPTGPSLVFQWTVDGLGSARALKLVEAGFRAELVVTPRLRMAAMIV